MDLSIVIPTTNQVDRVKEFRNRILAGLARQVADKQLNVEVVVVLNDNSATEFLVKEFNEVLGSGTNNINFSVKTFVHTGKIYDKTHAVVEELQGEVVLILDDDMEFQTPNLIEKCLRVLKQNRDTAAVCPYIYEPRGGGWLHNLISVGFYNFFKLWSVEDESFKVYNPFGKGYIDFNDKADTRTIHGCHWLPSATLFIKKQLLQTRLEMMSRDFEANFVKKSNSPWKSTNLWSVDMYLTYPLFLSGYNLAMLMDQKVTHWGYETTTVGFGFVNRIVNENLWGYYYYRMFFHKNAITFISKYLFPNVGRFFHYIFVPLVKKKNARLMVESIATYFYSFIAVLQQQKSVNWNEVNISSQLILNQNQTDLPVLLNQTNKFVN